MKYQLVDRNPETGLWRIQALRDFGIIKAGDRGGWIAGEHNLSHEGDCWIAGNAVVSDNARVTDDAWVSDNALVFGNARVSGQAQVYQNVAIFGQARVSGNARVFGKAWVSGVAQVSDNAWVSGIAVVCDNARVLWRARVSGQARVSGNARISNCAQVFDKAWVYGDAVVSDYAMISDYAVVSGHAIVGERQRISFGKLTVDITKNRNKEISIKLQTGLDVDSEGFVSCYKSVNHDLTSLYDPNFQYKVNEWVEEPNTDSDHTLSCGSGLHFSHMTYWQDYGTFLHCKVHMNDVVAVQEGKIRARKAFVIDKIVIERG
jgi:carbonic anhydrase/acetyltransferase-like protein (isoleucine patch superfamily)